jgi:hypothetical protein
VEALENIFSKIPNAIRWVLVPIAAIIAAVVVWLLAGIAAKLIVFFGNGRGWGENFFQYLLIPGIGTFFSVLTGAAIAPRYRAISAITLGVIWCFGAGATTFFIVLSGTWSALIAICSMCVGVAIAVFSPLPEPEDPSVESIRQPDISSAD